MKTTTVYNPKTNSFIIIKCDSKKIISVKRRCKDCDKHS